jgi:hypothetical protein
MRENIQQVLNLEKDKKLVRGDAKLKIKDVQIKKLKE